MLATANFYTAYYQNYLLLKIYDFLCYLLFFMSSFLTVIRPYFEYLNFFCRFLNSIHVICLEETNSCLLMHSKNVVLQVYYLQLHGFNLFYFHLSTLFNSAAPVTQMYFNSPSSSPTSYYYHVKKVNKIGQLAMQFSFNYFKIMDFRFVYYYADDLI